MKVNKASTGCPYLDEKRVGASDIGIHISRELEIEVTSQDVINYCIECPYDYCFIDDTRKGKGGKKNYGMARRTG